MKYLILYSTLYGSTKQIMEWIKQRLELDKNEVVLLDVKDFKESKSCDTLILATPVYSGKATKIFYRFLDKSFEKVSFEKFFIVGVAMQKKGCFDENQNLRFLDAYEQIRQKAILQEVLLGELVYDNLNKEYQEELFTFYKSMNLDEKQIKNMLSPRTLLSKKDVWDFAQKI